MTAPEDAIRARRRLTNKIIAAHDSGRLKPFLDPQIKVIVGDGSLILGAPAVLDAFAAQFRDPDFVTYVRTTSQVQLDAEGGGQAKPAAGPQSGAAPHRCTATTSLAGARLSASG